MGGGQTKRGYFQPLQNEESVKRYGVCLARLVCFARSVGIADQPPTRAHISEELRALAQTPIVVAGAPRNSLQDYILKVVEAVLLKPNVGDGQSLGLFVVYPFLVVGTVPTVLNSPTHLTCEFFAIP